MCQPPSRLGRRYPTGVPIYEFRCSTCDIRLEERREISRADAAAPSCSVCGAPTRRVLSVFATVDSPGTAPAGGCGPGCACAAR